MATWILKSRLRRNLDFQSARGRRASTVAAHWRVWRLSMKGFLHLSPCPEVQAPAGIVLPEIRATKAAISCAQHLAKTHNSTPAGEHIPGRVTESRGGRLTNDLIETAAVGNMKWMLGNDAIVTLHESHDSMLVQDMSE